MKHNCPSICLAKPILVRKMCNGQCDCLFYTIYMYIVCVVLYVHVQIGFNLSCYFIYMYSELSDGEKSYTRQLLLVCQYTNEYSLLYCVKCSHQKCERGWGPKTSFLAIHTCTLIAFICSTFNYDYIYLLIAQGLVTYHTRHTLCKFKIIIRVIYLYR